MFREMRRKRELLNEEENLDIINRGTSGVLSLLGEDGYPYGVPVSYAYMDSKFYFHGAIAGHKIDAIKGYDKASFTIVDLDQVVPEENTTYFKSVIAFGKIHIVEDEEVFQNAMKALGEKYNPKRLGERIEDEVSRTRKRLCVMELTVEHMTGKQAVELVRKKND